MPVAITDSVWVAGQIQPQDIADLAQQGVRRIVCNRPDHEEHGQPERADLEAAATAAGVEFVFAPIQGMPGPEAVSLVAEALEDGSHVLLYCRSGMRSTAAWAMARSSAGDDPEQLRALAANAGYDLSRLPL